MAISIDEARNRPGAQPVYLTETTLKNGGPTLYLSDRNITVGGQFYINRLDDLTGIGDELRRADSSGLNANITLKFSNETINVAYNYLIETGETYPFEGASEVIKEVYLENGVPSDVATVFSGILDQPEGITEAGFSCKVSSKEFMLNECWQQDKITLDNYPYADPDAIGKYKNLLIGAVDDVPGYCTRGGGYSTVVADITAAQLFVDLSLGVNEAKFPAVPYTANCESEQMRVTTAPGAATVKLVSGLNYTCILGHVSATSNKPGTGADWQLFWMCMGSGGGTWVAGATYKSIKTVVVTRAYGGSTAAVHVVGRPFWEDRPNFKYNFAGHPSKAINAVKVNGVLVTSGITMNVNDAGETTVVFSSKFTLKKVVDLMAADSGHTHGISAVTSWTGLSASHFTIGSPTITGVDANVYDQSALTSLKAEKASGTAGTYYCHTTINFPAFTGGTVGRMWACITHNSYGTATYSYAKVTVNGVDYILSCPVGDPGKITQKIPITGSVPISMIFKAGLSGGSGSFVGELFEAWLEFEVTDTSSGTASLSVTGNSAADIIVGGMVTADIEGYSSPNNNYGGIGTLAERPDWVFKLILVEYTKIFALSEVDSPSFAAAGAFYAAAIHGGYTFGFCIGGNNSLVPRDLLKQMAANCRSTIKYINGKWYLNVIPDASPAADMVIDHKALAGKGSMFTFDKTARKDIANDLTAVFKRDYSGKAVGAAKGWLGTAQAADNITGGSIGKYGRYPRTDIEFMCIRSQAMADDVLAHMLLESKQPLKLVKFPVFYDLFNLVVGNTISIVNPLYNNTYFFIESMKRIDKFRADAEGREWWGEPPAHVTGVAVADETIADEDFAG